MKKRIAIFCMLAMLFSLGACGSHNVPGGSPGPTNGETAANGSAEPQGDPLQVRVIRGAGAGQLVLAGINSGEVYTANETELTVYLDGKTAAPSDLENGMLLAIDPGCTVLESWPAQLVGATVRAYSKPADRNDHGDLCGLYLQVLEDLWKDDGGLNSDITYVSVDLGNAPGALTEGEKAAIAWVFSGAHDKQGLRFSFEELKENGYIDESALYWEDGVLLSIKKAEKGSDSPQKISFDAQKWRSGLGAVFYMDCAAERGNGVQWEPYKTGSFAIS